MDTEMLYLILGIATVVIFSGILMYFESKWERGFDEEQIDNGKIVDLNYSPSHTSSSVRPTYTFGKGGGVGLTYNSHTTPERHLVVIRGNFYKKVVIDDEAFYNEVEEGQKTEVVYAMKYKVHKETKERRDLGQKILAVVVEGKRYNIDDLNVLEAENI